MNRARHIGVIAAGVALALAGCGDDAETVSPTLLDVPETVALGVLPEPLTGAPTLPPPPPPPTSERATDSTPAPSDEPIEGPIGAEVLGDRIILIGDGILAATAPRNGGVMCDALALFGWDAEIDAEQGRRIDFADEVLDARMAVDGDPEWDVVALSFGSSVDGTDPDAVSEFAEALDAVIDRVAPRPTILYTLVEGIDGRGAINEAIRERPRFHPNVVVVEFADAGSDGVALLDDLGQSLSEEGMNRFSIRTAAALGQAPGDTVGSCLPTQFFDDSGASE